jgi:hypothetical protein
VAVVELGELSDVVVPLVAVLGAELLMVLVSGLPTVTVTASPVPLADAGPRVVTGC